MSFESWMIFVSYIITVFTITILSMLSSIKYWNIDKKIIDREKINVLEYNDINNIDNYSIFIPNRSKKWKDVTFERYFIVDDNNNLLYKVKQYGLMGLKYIIVDQFDNKVGEIRRKGYMTYIVRLVNQEPFAVKWILNTDANNFKVIGLDYKVQGSESGLESIISYNSVEDIVATVKSNSILGETKVNIKRNTTNKQKIIAISLVIKIGAIRHWNMKFK